MKQMLSSFLVSNLSVILGFNDKDMFFWSQSNLFSIQPFHWLTILSNMNSHIIWPFSSLIGPPRFFGWVLTFVVFRSLTLGGVKRPNWSTPHNGSGYPDYRPLLPNTRTWWPAKWTRTSSVHFTRALSTVAEEGNSVRGGENGLWGRFKACRAKDSIRGARMACRGAGK